MLKKWSQLAAVALAQELLSGLPLAFGRRILWQPMLLGLFHDGIQNGLRMVWQLRLELQQLLKLGFFGGWLQFVSGVIAFHGWQIAEPRTGTGPMAVAQEC